MKILGWKKYVIKHAFFIVKFFWYSVYTVSRLGHFNKFQCAFFVPKG